MTLALAMFVACPAEAERVPGSEDTAEPTATVGCEPERCNNGIDDDCDGVIDEADDAADALTAHVDADGDGYGDPVAVYATCDAALVSLPAGDCDDGDALVNPGAVEVCDGTDNDCDGWGLVDCEWSGSLGVDKVAGFRIERGDADIVAGVDEETGESWVSTSSGRGEGLMFIGLDRTVMHESSAEASWFRDRNYPDPFYQQFYPYDGACVDLADLDGDGQSDLVVGLDPFSDEGWNQAVVHLQPGPLTDIQGFNLALSAAQWMGDGYFGGGLARCASGQDASGDGRPDVLASGIDFAATHVLDGATALRAGGDLDGDAVAVIRGAEVVAWGGWADFDGDGVAEVFQLETTGDESRVGAYLGPISGQMAVSDAAFVLTLDGVASTAYRTVQVPDRQIDASGDGLPDLVVASSGVEPHGLVLLIDGATLAGGGMIDQREADGRVLGAATRPIEQVVGVAGGDGEAWLAVGHKARDDNAWFVGDEWHAGVSIFSAPVSGVVMAHDAAQHVADPLQLDLGRRLAALPNLLLMGSYGRRYEPLTPGVMYGVPLGEGF